MTSQAELHTVKARWVYWTLQIVTCGAYFNAQASGEVIFASVSWRQAGLMWLGASVAGIALTNALRRNADHYAWLGLSSRALLLRLLVAIPLVTLAFFVTITLLSIFIYGSFVPPIVQAMYPKLLPSRQLLNQFIGALAIISLWTAVYFSVVLQRRHHAAQLRQAQLAEALQTAELRLLKAQLNPHFLFNALNSVRALIADEPAKAQDAVTRLARTLRYTLTAGEEDFVTLAREMEIVEDYLALEELRLADRLHLVRDIEPGTMPVRVPVMLLQTLVENGIKHGIAQLKQGGTLHIAAHISGGKLVIRVENSCPLEAHARTSNGRIGLKNLSSRLSLLFGQDARFDLDFSKPGVALATASMPT